MEGIVRMVFVVARGRRLPTGPLCCAVPKETKKPSEGGASGGAGTGVGGGEGAVAAAAKPKKQKAVAAAASHSVLGGGASASVADAGDGRVDPWSVAVGEGGIDYGKLLIRFGCSPITEVRRLACLCCTGCSCDGPTPVCPFDPPSHTPSHAGERRTSCPASSG